MIPADNAKLEEQDKKMCGRPENMEERTTRRPANDKTTDMMIVYKAEYSRRHIP